MRLLLHQVRKDVTYVRWPLALWLACLAATTAAEALKLDLLLPGAEGALRLSAACSALHALLTLLAWLLAIRIVHGDPADGTSSFWLTRPLGARRMFVAKIVSILSLFVVVPALGRTVVAAVQGLSGWMLLRFFGEAAIVELAFVLAAVLLATLTRDLARVALGVIALVAAFAVLHTTAPLGLFAWLPTVHDVLTRNSGLLVGVAVFLGGSLLVIRHQYAMRRALFSLALAAGVLVLSATATAFWPWNFILRPGSPPAAFDVSRVAVSLADPGIVGRKYLYATFESRNNPPGWVVVPAAVSSALRLPNGSTVQESRDTWMARVGTSDSLMSPGPWGMTRDALLAVRHVTRAAWLNDPFDRPDARPRQMRTRTGAWLPLLELPDPLSVDGHIAGSLQVAVTCAAFRAGEARRLPLAPRARARLEGLEITLLRLPERTPGRVDLHVRVSQPRFLFPTRMAAVAFVLLNATRGEAAIGLSTPTRPDWRRVPRGVVHSLVRYETISFSGAVGRPLTVDAAWLRGAELAVVPLQKMGTFEKRVHVPALQLRAAE